MSENAGNVGNVENVGILRQANECVTSTEYQFIYDSYLIYVQIKNNVWSFIVRQERYDLQDVGNLKDQCWKCWKSLRCMLEN